jgi:chemotaxis signal transduction protein
MTLPESEFDFPAEPLGEGQTESGGEKFISFELGGRLCCVPACGVAEVVQPMAVAPLPNSPSWLLGLAAHRGEPVAVIDPTIIAKSAGEDRGKAKTIVFRERPNEIRFALQIDSLYEMILAPAAENRRQEYLHNGRPVVFIDHERLFENLNGGQRPAQ